MHRLKIISTFIIITSLFYFGCSETLVFPPEQNSINIEFPIGKKAVYAVGLYEGESVDSLQVLGVNIFSLQFDTVLTKTDGIEYIGNIELYYSILDTTLGTGAEFISTGSIKVSVDDKWVLFQYSDIIGSAYIFMKQTLILTDTTLLPTIFYNQFPVFPKLILRNTQYSVYRPNDDSLRFLDVQRNFDVKNYVDWTDIYGSSRGLFYNSKHLLPMVDFEIDINGIIDQCGVVTSSFSVELINTSAESPALTDTILTHQINRRIVDFTEPENIKDLSWYSDYVLENGLIYLDEQYLQ